MGLLGSGTTAGGTGTSTTSSQPVKNSISLSTELALAGLGGVIAGLGAFTGALSQTTASDTKALASAGIGAGFTALVFFTNSLRNWYNNRNGTSV